MKNRILYLLISVFALSCVPTAAAERIGMPVRRAIGRTLSRIVAREVSGGYVKVQGVDASRGRGACLCLGRTFLLPLSRRERRSHARFGPGAAAPRIPQSADRTLHRRPRDRRTDSDGLPRPPIRCAGSSPGGGSFPSPTVPRGRWSSGFRPPCGPGRGLRAGISPCGRATDAISTSRRTAGNGSVRSCGRPARTFIRRDTFCRTSCRCSKTPGRASCCRASATCSCTRCSPTTMPPGQYAESGVWEPGGAGFAHLRQVYRAGENPFRDGTTRRTRSVRGEATGSAVWRADIPERGEYAVYVSYESLPESADDAEYTVHHLGGDTKFAVNQTMGGGTWIYLGGFLFDAGEQAVVTLSNRSREAGRVVSADAVKIGGGYGNVARTVCDSLRIGGGTYAEETSGYPPFLRGGALLAPVGRVRRGGLYSERRDGRLQGRLHVACALGQCSCGRFGADARLRGTAHSGRYGAGVPFRRGRSRRRRDDRHAGHLLHAREQGPLRGRRRPLSFARPDRSGDDPDRLGHPPRMGAGVEPPRTLEPGLLRSPCPRRADDAARTALAPEFRRHALRQRPALPVLRGACRL